MKYICEKQIKKGKEWNKRVSIIIKKKLFDSANVGSKSFSGNKIKVF
jgi:hypothetical protein